MANIQVADLSLSGSDLLRRGKLPELSEEQQTCLMVASLHFFPLP